MNEAKCDLAFPCPGLWDSQPGLRISAECMGVSALT